MRAVFLLPFLLFFLIHFVYSPSGTVPPPDLTSLLCEQITDEKGRATWDCYINQKRKVNIFGTEYLIGQKQTVWLQLLDKELPVDNASCLLTMWNPDNNKILNNAPMNFLEKGVYYYDLFLTQEGVYKLIISCKYVLLTHTHYYDNVTILNGTRVDTLTFSEGSNDRLDILIFFKNVTFDDSNKPHPNQTAIDIISKIGWFGQKGSTTESEVLQYLIFNFNTSTYELLSNITVSSAPVDYNFHIENFTKYVRNGTLILRIRDNVTNSVTSTLTIANIQVNDVSIAQAFTNDIRGGGEIHIWNQTRIFASTPFDITSIQDLLDKLFKKIVLFLCSSFIKIFIWSLQC